MFLLSDKDNSDPCEGLLGFVNTRGAVASALIAKQSYLRKKKIFLSKANKW
jgi:hypothetical protein